MNNNRFSSGIWCVVCFDWNTSFATQAKIDDAMSSKIQKHCLRWHQLWIIHDKLNIVYRYFEISFLDRRAFSIVEMCIHIIQYINTSMLSPYYHSSERQHAGHRSVYIQNENICLCECFVCRPFVVLSLITIARRKLWFWI